MALAEPRTGPGPRWAMALVVASLALLAVPLAASAVTPSGIRGIVIKSPTKPVCEEGVPCSAPAAGVTLVFMRSGVRVASATTTRAGTYRLVLPPGSYVIRLPRRISGSLMSTVRVRAGGFTVADFEIDTGIR